MQKKKNSLILLLMLLSTALLSAQVFTLTVRVTGLYQQADSPPPVDSVIGELLAVNPADNNSTSSIGFRELTQFQYPAGTMVSFMLAVPGAPLPGISFAYNHFSHLEGDFPPTGGRFPMLRMDKDYDITAVYTYTVNQNSSPLPSPTPRPLLGDVNQDDNVTIIDALMIAQYFVGLNPPNFDPSVADVNSDARITIVDALIVAQYYVCLLDCSLPLEAALARVANPFDGAGWYVERTWSAQAAAGGGEAIAGYNTAIWLESIGSLTNNGGVRGHLEDALTQGASLIMFVLYDIPNRECAGSSYSEYDPQAMRRYKTEYIDPLAAIFADPAYKSIRIVCIIEPDSLPHLVTSLNIARCQEAAGTGGYVEGIQYALNRLSAVPNVYNYLDIANSAWLGWSTNFNPYVNLLYSCVRGTTKGFGSLSGFISNISTYNALQEPFLPDPELQIDGKPLYSSVYYEYNHYFEELKYALDMRTALIAKGFPSTIGMLIDTSRNGWGGPQRPGSVSTSGDLNSYVDESRIDRRLHRGNWCNQPSGIGERPVANPVAGIHAYVWAYPPGISDGISYPGGPQDPNDPALTFDRMCDPTGASTYNSAFATGAIQSAPHRGRWNQLHFDLLLQNAYPPLP